MREKRPKKKRSCRTFGEPVALDEDHGVALPGALLAEYPGQQRPGDGNAATAQPQHSHGTVTAQSQHSHGTATAQSQHSHSSGLVWRCVYSGPRNMSIERAKSRKT